MPKSKILNQVQDLVRHDNSVILNSFQNPISDFDIHLTLACLREAPPCGAKAGAWDLVLILNTMARSQ